MEETAHSASTAAGTAAETAAPRSHSLCQTHARAMASGSGSRNRPERAHSAAAKR